MANTFSKCSASPTAACPLPVPQSQASSRAGATEARKVNNSAGYAGRDPRAFGWIPELAEALGAAVIDLNDRLNISTTHPLNLTVTDVRQFTYCPRIPYYRYTLPLERPVTAKMDLGKEEHESTSAKEARRTLKAYGIKEGERRFGVSLYSESLGLRGKIDMVILTPREVIPVEYKMAAGVGLHHKYQLAAYAMLVEHALGGTVNRAFAYLTPAKEAREVPITPAMRAEVKKTLERLRASMRDERLPRPTPHRKRCVACEYRRFCGDVLTERS